MMQICTRCVLDERFPGIRFDENGVCSFCHSARPPSQRAEERAEYDAKLVRLFAEHKADGGYDCLAAFSGGKDSTYTLHLLKKKYGLRVLALSYDNWFQSAQASRNIRAVLRAVEMDHVMVTPSFELVKQMTLASVESNSHSTKALTRASSICSSCISLIRLIALRTVVERHIPFMAFGMSPGQAPIATAIVKLNADMVRAMQNAFVRPLRDRVGDLIQPFLLEERHFEDTDRFPYSINPLAFVEYDEAAIFEAVGEYGWRKPKDTDANSTNCLMNSFANDVHMRRFGYNPYAYEIAELVRGGHLTRDEGLRRLAEEMRRPQVAMVSKALGLDSREVDCGPVKNMVRYG